MEFVRPPVPNALSGPFHTRWYSLYETAINRTRTWKHADHIEAAVAVRTLDAWRQFERFRPALARIALRIPLYPHTIEAPFRTAADQLSLEHARADMLAGHPSMHILKYLAVLPVRLSRTDRRDLLEIQELAPTPERFAAILVAVVSTDAKESLMDTYWERYDQQ